MKQIGSEPYILIKIKSEKFHLVICQPVYNTVVLYVRSVKYGHSEVYYLVYVYKWMGDVVLEN